LKKTDCALEVK